MSTAPTPAAPAVPRHYREPGPVVIEIENVTKLYKMGAEIVHALRGVSLTVRRNEYLAVMGPPVPASPP
jgi:putative ABC transport system ATP-binding protein